MQRAVGVPFHVHAETPQQIERMLLRNTVAHRHPLEGGKGGVIHWLASHRAMRLVLQLSKLAPCQDRIEANRAVAHDLTVDLVVAITAPGIEHIGVFADARIEQARGGSEAGRAAFDTVTASVDDRVTHGRAANISEAVALAEPITPGTPAPGWVPAPTM